MAMAALPPALEAVRQALLIPPPSYVETIEPVLSGLVADRVREVDAKIDAARRLFQAHTDLIRAGVANLKTLIEDGSGVFPVDLSEVVSAHDKAINDAAATIEQVKRDRTALLQSAARAGLRPQIKRLFDKLERTIIENHAALVESYYGLLTIEADHDPESRQIVANASTPAEIDTFFASLHA